MKRQVGRKWSVGVVLATVSVGMLVSPLVVSASDRVTQKEQCSMAVFSKPAAKTDHICDEQTVRKLARHGQVFEQNQMGIASILGIAAGSDAKDALFQRDGIHLTDAGDRVMADVLSRCIVDAVHH